MFVFQSYRMALGEASSLGVATCALLVAVDFAQKHLCIVVHRDHELPWPGMGAMPSWRLRDQ